jgi:adenylate kinase
MAAFAEVFGPTLKGKKGNIDTACALAGKTVALYFSAHWHPPCRVFTQKLAQYYERNLKDKGMEIVFVSSDSSGEDFDKYCMDMPWLALPFECRSKKNVLSENFNIRGIPSLVILDNDGPAITADSMSKIMVDISKLVANEKNEELCKRGLAPNPEEPETKRAKTSSMDSAFSANDESAPPAVEMGVFAEDKDADARDSEDLLSKSNQLADIREFLLKTNHVAMSPDASRILHVDSLGFIKLLLGRPSESPQTRKVFHIKFDEGAVTAFEQFVENPRTWSIAEFQAEFGPLEQATVVDPKVFGISFGCAIKSVEHKRMHRCSQDTQGHETQVTTYEVQVFNASGNQVFGKEFQDSGRDGPGSFGQLGQQRVAEELAAGATCHHVGGHVFVEYWNYSVEALVLDVLSKQTNETSHPSEQDKEASQPLKMIICGAPASGKGTQCELLQDAYGVVHLSTGDMLRAAVKAGTEVGKQARSYMESGQLVPDDVIISIVKDRLAEKDCVECGWLLDGFPRTEAQAKALHSAGIVPNKVLFLNVPDELLVERIVGRRSDPETGKIYHLRYSPPESEEIAARLTQRADDTEEKIKPRLEAFHTHMSAVENCYANLISYVDGTKPKEAVFDELQVCLGGKGAKSACDIHDAPAMRVLNMSGEVVDVDLTDVNVAEIRRRVASALGVPVSCMKLLSGSTTLDDTAPLSDIDPSNIINALLASPGPSWYPACKYLHNDDEVLKITWGMCHNRSHEKYQYCIHYTDGTSVTASDEGVVTFAEDDKEKARLQSLFRLPLQLAEQFGFITHKLRCYSDQPCMSFSWEAVPSEDPDEWESYSDGYCVSGQRRKVSFHKLFEASSLVAAPLTMEGAFSVSIVDLGGESQEVKGLLPSTPVRELHDKVATLLNVDIGKLQLSFGETAFTWNDHKRPLHEIGISDGASIACIKLEDDAQWWKDEQYGYDCVSPGVHVWWAGGNKCLEWWLKLLGCKSEGELQDLRKQGGVQGTLSFWHQRDFGWLTWKGPDGTGKTIRSIAC